VGKLRPLVSKDFTRIKGISSGLAFHTPAATLHKADVQILHRESKMIGSYAIEQQAFMEQANVSERSRPEPADLSESEAIRRAQRGDADALARIYQLHCRRVYGLCLRMAGNPTEAEDLTQDAFLTVLRKIQTFRGDSAFSTWLHRITVNLVLMSYRKNALLESSPEKTNEPDGDRGRPHEELGGPDLLLAGSIDRVNLQRAMDQLTPCHKLVVELHDIQGYKHKEIAQIMDWSIGNSKAQLHRARRRLRGLLRETLRLEWLTPPQALHAQLSQR
jgi:RNA polymerase sigma-70 factor (ECF subfamily)